MASEVDIVNLALSHLALDSVVTLNEATKSAREAKKVIPFIRKASLAAHDWGFARKQAVLSLLDETRTGWEYVYAYPNDCARALSIYDPSSSTAYSSYDTDIVIQDNSGIPFEIGISTDLSKRVILTNQESAELIYTADVTDVNAYDYEFIEVFALHLAVALSIPLKRDRKLRADIMNDYRLKLSSAMASSANEENKQVDNSSSFTRARA